MRVLIAPDKFKGTFTAMEVAETMAAPAGDAEVELCPVADGGDGTAAVLLEALGGEWVGAAAHDALGRRIECRYAHLGDGSAVVEVAEASGLSRLDPAELDPIGASSAGTGELVAAAIERGAHTVMVACGGSATTDGGLGALGRFDPRAAEIVCLCDVRDRFEGAIRFAPQKGASGPQLDELARRLERIAAELPRDPRPVEFTGAAGGLAGGLWAHGARLVAGADHVLDAVGFDRRLAAAHTVLTGEGRLDETSAAGKALGEVARRAQRAGVPCYAIVGQDRGDDALVTALGLADVLEATDEAGIAAQTRSVLAARLDGEV